MQIKKLFKRGIVLILVLSMMLETASMCFAEGEGDAGTSTVVTESPDYDEDASAPEDGIEDEQEETSVPEDAGDFESGEAGESEEEGEPGETGESEDTEETGEPGESEDAEESGDAEDTDSSQEETSGETGDSELPVHGEDDVPALTDEIPKGPENSENENQPTPVEDMTLEMFKDVLGTYIIDDSVLTYKEYIKKYPEKATSSVIEIAGKDYYKEATEMTVAVKNNSEYAAMIDSLAKAGLTESLLTAEDGFVSWKFKAEQSGYYYINISYFPVPGKNADIERAFFLDGKLPYAEMTDFKFSRIWVNSVVFDATKKAWEWNSDNQGNQLKPSQKEAPDWMSSYLYDSNGYISNALPIYVEAGEHVLTMVSIKEPMLVYSIRMDYLAPTISYGDYKAKHDAEGAKPVSSQLITIQAEQAVRKSSQMLYPQQDQSSPAIEPYSARYLLNNTIGGNSWRLVGQWIEWDFDVPEDGYYNLALAVRQNFSKGIYVSRKISIDGEVPFDEFNAYGFQYESSWRQEVLGNKDGAFDIYLKAGSHTIRMEVVLGEFSDIVSDVQLAVTRLNAIYREIICITGTNPDSWKDYQIARNLPQLEAECIEVRDLLNDIISRLRKLVGTGSDKETVLITMRDQLDDIIEDVEYVVKVVSTFRTNIRACGTWITQVIEQPLALDAIYVVSDTDKMPEMKDSWWRKLLHELKRLFYSFIIDYNMIGDVSDGGDQKLITLWVGTGRDQANVIKSMIDETFAPKAYTNSKGEEYHIGVNVMLVDMGTLLQATLAGSGPDVAIQVGNDVPMNYGIRNAVADLSQFPDCEQVIAERFRPSAMEAFRFTGKDGHTAVYGLPETQTFSMMFYRKDILKELNLTVPTTWEEMKVTLTVLSQNNMDLGMMPTEANFAMLLYQNGGEYYNEDGSKSALDSEEAVSAFRIFTEFYTDFKMDTVTSVEERFRTGEAPIIIQDYTYYNTLQVSAPDIAGLWDMAVVPGTVKVDENGKQYVDNTVASSGSACIIMEASKHKEACWEFLKWWTSAETQYLYSSEMESLMGAAARVATANIEAFGMIPWPSNIAEALEAQFENVRGIRQVPGGYFSWRNVNNAFYAVTTATDSATPREELMDRVIYINDEISYKRKEFKLD